jgi:DNA gyrase subunit B
LSQLSTEFLAVQAAIGRLARRYDRRVLEELLVFEPLSTAMLADEAASQAVVVDLQKRLADTAVGSVYTVTRIALDDGEHEINVQRDQYGAFFQTRLNREFLSSNEYQSICTLGERLRRLVGSSARVTRGERSAEVGSFSEAMDWLLSEARRGMNISRYKGLGEMNPDQLWETTMDMEQRRLLRVTVEDGVAADQTFTMLMGDQVEPRREFIEKNAFAVNNLDV